MPDKKTYKTLNMEKLILIVDQATEFDRGYPRLYVREKGSRDHFVINSKSPIDKVERIV